MLKAPTNVSFFAVFAFYSTKKTKDSEHFLNTVASEVDDGMEVEFQTNN